MSSETLSDRLRYALRILDVSQSELAKRINIKPQMIQYLCASSTIKSKFTFEIAEALNIDVTWLATGKGIAPVLHIKERNIPLLSFRQIKEYRINGKKIDSLGIESWLPVSNEIHKNAFALILNDRSMAPRFDLGTLVIIDPSVDVETLSKTNIYVLVYIENEDFLLFRQLLSQQNTEDLLLIPMNDSLYKQVFLGTNDIIIGVCKEARWNN